MCNWCQTDWILLTWFSREERSKEQAGEGDAGGLTDWRCWTPGAGCFCSDNSSLILSIGPAGICEPLPVWQDQHFVCTLAHCSPEVSTWRTCHDLFAHVWLGLEKINVILKVCRFRWNRRTPPVFRCFTHWILMFYTLNWAPATIASLCFSFTNWYFPFVFLFLKVSRIKFDSVALLPLNKNILWHAFSRGWRSSLGF